MLKKEDLGLEISKEEFAYGFIIEVLTGGLYPNKFHVIREYIQNSFDAICKWRRDPNFDEEGSIKIKIDGNSIIIFDTGIGMDKEKINQYRYVGYSEKKLGEATGFRGIGKLSGISVAEKLIITSSTYGSKERYKLIFDTKEMILEILELKSIGENIALNELMRKHTSIIQEEENENLHYTIVELNNIHEDSKVLLGEDSLVNFIGMNCPVGFDPAFEFGEEIDEKIKEMIDDYETVIIEVGGREVCKPYITSCKRPEYNIILKEESDENEPEVLYFTWYCKNTESGQFEDKDKSGLLFKFKNFTIGDRFFTREKLWAATPERAFYFFGEVYVNDKNIVPTSERNNFVQNEARKRLFSEGKKIGRILSKVAGKDSDQGRALQKLKEFEETTNKVEKEYEEGGISKELEIPKLVLIYNYIDDAKKRLNKLPAERDKQKSRVIMRKAQALITKIKKSQESTNINNKLYDITKDLEFDKSCKNLYEIIIKSIQDLLIDDTPLCEELIKKIHSSLRERWR